MNPRLFIGNFDFEHRLADAERNPSAKLKRLNAELAANWLSIARDGDWIWTPEPINASFFHEAANSGLPRVVPATSFRDIPQDVECVPWGWSGEVRQLVERYGWHASPPPESAVRLANSRSMSEELERLWGVELDGRCRIQSLAEVKTAIQAANLRDHAWVMKAEFGMSARERILGRGPLSAADENWVRRRLASHGVVSFEPWVTRISEVGIQIDVPQVGDPRLIGLTPMLVDGRGQYSGSWFAFRDSRFAIQRSHWAEAIDVAMQAAAHLRKLGYHGPLGIDAMIYRDESGNHRIRPLQDINARWTMGRLSLGWRQLLQPGDEGCWQHGTRHEHPDLAEFHANQIVWTSPETVGGQACRHVSRILIQRTGFNSPASVSQR